MRVVEAQCNHHISFLWFANENDSCFSMATQDTPSNLLKNQQTREWFIALIPNHQGWDFRCYTIAKKGTKKVLKKRLNS